MASTSSSSSAEEPARKQYELASNAKSALMTTPPSTPRTVRLAYLVSHPIQYQAPLLRRIAREPGIDLTVFFGSDFSVRGYKDEGFGVEIKWDVPLLEGYKHEFLPALRDNATEGTFSPISRGLSHRLARGKFDVLWVHGYATVNQMQGILAAKSLGLPVLVRSESWLRDRDRSPAKLAAKRIFFHALSHLVDAAVVTGTLNRQYWQHYMGPDFPLFLTPYAVDNARIAAATLAAAASRPALQAELALDPTRPVILFASKLQSRKHCDDLIAAYAALCAGPAPHPYLLIVGDGEERAALESQAAATGLDGIRFCGFRNQSELPRFFDLAAVFVLPSRHEPWGLIVNEVMAAGRPVIVTDDCGCAPDLITNGTEGFVYPVRDVPALTTALAQVLANHEQMGQAAQKRIQAWSFEQDVEGLKAALALLTGKLPRQAGPAA